MAELHVEPKRHSALRWVLPLLLLVLVVAAGYFFLTRTDEGSRITGQEAADTATAPAAERPAIPPAPNERP